jgi:1-acyl-sn-glycerol-3-phosphate acyltransferase
MAGVPGAKPSVNEASFTGQTRARIFCETRRLWRLARLVAHVLVGTAIAHGVFGVWTLTGVDRDQRRRHALVRWWNHGVLRVLNVHLRLEGQIASGAVLYTANHISWLDIPCLRAVVDAAFVAKDEVRRWPVIGRLSERAGTIFLRRGGHSAANDTAEHMTWSLARRRPVIVFPEGTTSEGHTVRYFYGRLYQSAVRTQGVVQAVAIAYPHAGGAHPRVPFVGDDDLVRHLWHLLYEDRIDARLVFCAPLPAAGGERRALAARSRVQILETLGLMPGTAKSTAPITAPEQAGR